MNEGVKYKEVYGVKIKKHKSNISVSNIKKIENKKEKMVMSKKAELENENTLIQTEPTGKSKKMKTLTAEQVEKAKKPAKLILNEGLYVLDESLREIIDVKVYVYTPFEIIKDRWYKRAIVRGKTGAAADMQFNDVNQTAFRYIRPTMQMADIVINGLTTQEYIEEVAQKFIKAITDVTKDFTVAKN